MAACAAAAAGCGGHKHSLPFVGPTLRHPAHPPNFTLHDEGRRRVDLAALRGKVVLLTFLYTHCPDVCPVTAGNLNTMLQRLGPERRDVEVLAVSVDPIGDTPAAVRQFLRAHRLRPEFHYLTGSEQKLAPVWRAYNVAAVRHSKGDVDHTLYTLLIDRSGLSRVVFDTKATPAAMVHDVRLLLT